MHPPFLPTQQSQFFPRRRKKLAHRRGGLYNIGAGQSSGDEAGPSNAGGAGPGSAGVNSAQSPLFLSPTDEAGPSRKVEDSHHGMF